jgi:hypothetical protein
MTNTTYPYSLQQDRADAVYGYATCALWTALDYHTEGEEPGQLDDVASLDDFSEDAWAKIIEEVGDFIDGNQDDFDAYLLAYTPSDASYTAAECFGHDFSLTREGHGTGFWDRGLGDLGERLSEAARVYGDQHLWLDRDTGKVEVDL